MEQYWTHSKPCSLVCSLNIWLIANNIFHFRKFQEQITSQYDDVGMRCERDAFDTLFDCAPDKLAVVKKSLITFVNKHLSKLNFEVNNLSTDFKDGVYLCLLMGLLGGFFVPLYDFHLTPKDPEHMVNYFLLVQSFDSQKFDSSLHLIHLDSQCGLLVWIDARCWASKTKGAPRRYRQYGFEINFACFV